jgi:hypothetical protein
LGWWEKLEFVAIVRGGSSAFFAPFSEKEDEIFFILVITKKWAKDFIYCPN